MTSEATTPPVDPEDKVDLAAERAAAGLDTYLAEIDNALVGLAPVKRRISEIAALLLIDRVRRRLELVTQPPTLHMSFTGNPGTGKTTVARTMAEMLHRLGYLRTPRLVSVTRDDLVGEYIGHTAPKTKEVLKRAMGGVLFIDEAYNLHRPENERDYGQEAIDILLQTMEDKRDDLVVILAGYSDRMERFYNSNPGFRSRVAHHVEFPDYTDLELVVIAERMLAEQNYRLSEDGVRALGDYIALRRQQPHFANARSIRNALDRARLRQANRHVSAGIVKIDDLSVIDGDDIRASRVFSTSVTDEDQ
ncbi:MAG: CbbX protein [Actinomycetota bacterium]